MREATVGDGETMGNGQANTTVPEYDTVKVDERTDNTCDRMGE